MIGLIVPFRLCDLQSGIEAGFVLSFDRGTATVLSVCYADSISPVKPASSIRRSVSSIPCPSAVR